MGDRIRKVRVKAWPDCQHVNLWGVNVWGVEVDDPHLTTDGHYICTTGPGEEGMRRAQVIADALNGKRTPMKEKHYVR